MTDYLRAHDENYRLAFKSLTLNGDIVLMNMMSEVILFYLKREITHLICEVDYSKKKRKPFYILENIEEFHLELNDAPELMKGEIIYVKIDSINHKR